MINTVIYTKTEEQMQGIIRGIEALDSDHKIAIIHGAFNMEVIDETSQLISDLTNAVIITTQEISFPLDNDGKEVIPQNVLQLHIPEELQRDEVIDYISHHYPDILMMISMKENNTKEGMKKDFD